MRIGKALIVADPWLGYILDGSKTWEMRSSAASHRGWFGLIRKSTGAVNGVARLIGTGKPLSPDAMIATFERHRIPEDMIRSGEVAKWNTPWILADVRRLPTPVPYRHRNGAVTWVELDESVSAAIEKQMGETGDDTQGPIETQLMSGPPPTDGNAAKASPMQPRAPLLDGVPLSRALIGQVEITQGNLDNSHIYLRSFFSRFPADAVGGSNRHEKAAREVLVDWGGGLPVQTDLDGSKKFFRARSWIRDFFDRSGAEAGDQVLVEETGPYAYSVRLRKAGRA